MSEERDVDYKPKLQSHRAVQQLAPNRPRRATRKQTNYDEAAITVESEEESTSSTVEGAVGSEGNRVQEVDSERLWSETPSDSTVKSGQGWSPLTMHRRTDQLISGLVDLKTQLG